MDNLKKGEKKLAPVYDVFDSKSGIMLAEQMNAYTERKQAELKRQAYLEAAKKAEIRQTFRRALITEEDDSALCVTAEMNGEGWQAPGEKVLGLAEKTSPRQAYSNGWTYMGSGHGFKIHSVTKVVKGKAVDFSVNTECD